MPDGSPQVHLTLVITDGDDMLDESDAASVDRWVRERLVDFQFTDSSDKLDECRISFENNDRALTDAGAFMQGMKFAVSWGWRGALAPYRQMVVVKREQNNPYVVWMRDMASVLNQRTKGRNMANVTDSEFVRRVAQEWGYRGPTARITATTVRHAITQPANRTDAGQLWTLAKKNGFEFYIDAEGLYWGPRQLSEEPVRTFVFRSGLGQGSILGEPQIAQITDRAFAAVTVHARDPQTKRSFTIELSNRDYDWQSLGAEIEMADPLEGAGSKRQSRTNKYELRPAGYMTEEEARTLARAIYRDNAQGIYKLSMTIIGDAVVSAKRLIQLVGHSIPYDGLYYITEATHSIKAGSYEVAIAADRDALSMVNAGSKVRRRRGAPILRLEDSVIEGDDGRLQNMAPYVRYTANGEGRAAWMWVNDAGEANGITRDMTEDEINALDDRTLRALAREGAMTPLPD